MWIIAIMLLTILLAAGCTIGGLFARRHEYMKTLETCLKREGGERCNQEITWAKCVAFNGVGHCEGIMDTVKNEQQGVH